MKVAVVYNRESQRVINLFGSRNREKYGLKSIKRISDALRDGGHQVTTLEGDKDLIDNLEQFMPRVVKGERPGMVFNLAYGIQGQARYTHVPGMLEMIGLPYVGSGPLAHSLALDKVVSKMIFVQNGIPTAEFAVLEDENFEAPDLEYPLITKPKNEAVSFGIKIVNSEEELREAASVIFREFEQAVLVERYIAGREVNVGILGNRPAEALPPAELIFGEGPQIYTLDDKMRKSGREVRVECPAKLNPEQSKQAQEIALHAFRALGCYDCARIDMRLDDQGNFYVLEINSLPSLGEHGSYVQGAQQAGLDFPALVNRLVEVASARYFGTPSPPVVSTETKSKPKQIVQFISSRRDRIEREVEKWIEIRSRTTDPVGLQNAVKKLEEELVEVGLQPIPEHTDPRVAWTWGTTSNLEDATLIVGHLDVPIEPDLMMQIYRREPERLYGEGIGSSRGPLVAMLVALRAMRSVRSLRDKNIAVMYYSDEGRDCRYSHSMISKAMARAKRALVLRPSSKGDSMVVDRRGQRRYKLSVRGEPKRLGLSNKKIDVVPWAFEKLQACTQLTSKADRIAVATMDFNSKHLPLLLPHVVEATILASYPSEEQAEAIDLRLREILKSREIEVNLELISSRPAMPERKANMQLFKAATRHAEQWEIPLRRESSVWPSVAGLAPESCAVLCGVGPAASNVYTPDESIDRISLIQRSILLAELLMEA